MEEQDFNILVVDDEKDILSYLDGALSKMFPCQVVGKTSGLDALEEVGKRDWKVILLDLSLPDMNGFEVLDKMREREVRTPVIVVSAHGDVEDKLKGFDCGCDDYIVKPFNIDELGARIKAVLKRSQISKSSVLTWGELKILPSSMQAEIRGEKIHFTKTEFLILEELLTTVQSIVKKESLVGKLWPNSKSPKTNLLEVHINNLRNKIKEYLPQDDVIMTVYGVGYIINQPPS